MTPANDSNSADPAPGSADRGPESQEDDSPTAVPYARLVQCMRLVEQTLAALFLFVILTTMGAQVFARYVLKTPIPWSEEMARFALVWMTFMAAAFVMAEGRHITVDLLSPRLSIRGQMRLECLSHAIVAGTCLLLLFGGLRFVWYVGKVGSPSLGIPKSWWYGAVDVGLLLMALHSVVNLLQVLATGRPTERESLAEEEAFHLEMELGK